MSASDILWEDLSPTFSENDPDGLLRVLANALAAPFEPLWPIVQSSWADVFDPELTPASALPYLAQFTGAILDPTMTEDQQRNAVTHPSGFATGTPDAIREAAQRYLTGSKSVLFQERFGSAYILLIRTVDSETPDEELVRQSILTQKPAGIVLDYASISGPDYGTLEATFTDYSDVESAGTYGDLETGA